MKKRTDVLFLLPSLAGFAAFYIIPFVYALCYAFTENAFSRKFVGLENFITLLNNRYFRLALGNTLRFSALAVPLSMTFSFIAAMLISHYAARLSIIRSAFFLPVLLPSAAAIAVWNAYFSNAAPFTSLLVTFLWKYTGLNMMLILTALLTIPRELYEAASIDGAGALCRIRYITLPHLMPMFFFTFVLSVMNSLKIYRESFLLYGNYPDESVYMLQNYLYNHFRKLNYQNIATSAVLFTVVVYIFVAAILSLEKKRSERIW
jgi:multiple sugar transport system permease protein